MDTQPSSTPQNVGSPLSSLFMNNTGYQPVQSGQLPTIQAPQYGQALTPSPEQAAAATRARMQARTPMAAPVSAPVVQKQDVRRGGEGGPGSSRGGGSQSGRGGSSY